MGVFLSVFFLGIGPGPGIAGWLYDRTGDAYVPILFAVGLTGLASPATSPSAGPATPGLP